MARHNLMLQPKGNPNPRRKWFRLAARVARLSLKSRAATAQRVTAGYDAIAPGYDAAWTDHMRDLSLDMLDRLAPPSGAECLDLTCGTGFVAEQLARRTGRRAVGVDASAGMIGEARRLRSEWADFVQADAVASIKARPAASTGVVTCAWGLGYSRPWRLVREMARVVRPGGRVGIIDNSLFSLAEVIWCSVLTFAERPEALTHVMNVRFLPSPWVLGTMMRLAGFRVIETYGGSRTYLVPSGLTAVERLTATGAAAGFESAAEQSAREEVFARFAEIIESRRRTDGIPITHRYLAAIGEKP